MYELASDLKEFKRINSLPPLAIAREIGKLELKLSKPSEEKQEIKKTTNAPKPLTPVGSKSAPVKKSPDEMSQKEYEAWRFKNMRSTG
jgi:hypothetical protein